MGVLFGCGQGVVFVPEIDSGKLAPMSMWLPMFCMEVHVASNCFGVWCEGACGSQSFHVEDRMFCVEEHVAPNVLCGGARGSLLSVLLRHSACGSQLFW